LITLRRLSLIFVVAAAALLAGAISAARVPAAAGVAPQAVLTATPNPAEINELVSFDGSGSTGDGQGSAITGYEWDLDGDGVFESDTGTAPKIGRTYAQARTTAVRLRVTDTEGDIAETSVSVRINAPPRAGFIFQPSKPKVGRRVVFSSTSRDADGTIPASGYAWDLDGDRQFDDATGETVSEVYSRAGTRRVRLLVSDADGAFAKAVKTVRIQPEQEPLKLMKPFPSVRLQGAITTGGQTEIDLLSVRGPKGAKATVECRGASCPFERRKRKIRRAKVEFPDLETRLQPGVVIEVSVTQPKRIGKFTRFKIRDGKVPKREDRCVEPDRRRPVDCPR
jgi:hypothetical protein